MTEITEKSVMANTVESGYESTGRWSSIAEWHIGTNQFVPFESNAETVHFSASLGAG
jgi:hypothetical protein